MTFALLLPRAKTPEPLPLVPVRPVWTLALNSTLAHRPAYDATRAYFYLDHDRLVAYDILSGAQSWLVDATAMFQPVTGNDLVFLVEPDAVVALRAGDGSVAWRTPLSDPLATAPAWDNGWLAGVTKSGTVLTFRASDGELVWQQDIGSAAHAPPAFAADRVYVPTSNGRIVALKVTDGSVIWERRIGGSPNDILALGDRIYAGSTDNFLYCLLTKDGQIDWRWRTGADVTGVPAADERRVYFVSFDNVLRALNRVSGGQVWMRPLTTRPNAGPQMAGTSIVVAGQSPAIRVFAAKDGAPANDINAGDEVAAPPHVLLHPTLRLPMLLVVTRNIARGDSVTLNIRDVDPPLVTQVAPLPNLVTLAPALPSRQ